MANRLPTFRITITHSDGRETSDTYNASNIDLAVMSLALDHSVSTVRVEECRVIFDGDPIGWKP